MSNQTKIGVIGSGDVAKALAAGFLKNGHPLMMGSRDPAKLDDWKADNEGVETGNFANVAKFGEIVVLAVKGTAASSALQLAGAENLDGKCVIDAANPISDSAPTNGVLPYFSSTSESLMESLQKEFPGTRFVKAFNSVGSGHMVDPQFEGGPPTMFYCGNDDAAKSSVRTIIEKFGWEPADMGKAESARAIEALCILWCLPGFLNNEWSHAFKLLK